MLSFTDRGNKSGEGTGALPTEFAIWSHKFNTMHSNFIKIFMETIPISLQFAIICKHEYTKLMLKLGLRDSLYRKKVMA